MMGEKRFANRGVLRAPAVLCLHVKSCCAFRWHFVRKRKARPVRTSPISAWAMCHLHGRDFRSNGT
eukprot:scaffold2729_cov191-Skeletonema_marinoi.AAC.2